MILDRLAASARLRVERLKQERPLEQVAREARELQSDGEYPFERVLAAPGMSFICEVKKASPSKGLIAPDFPYLEIARAYERAGAAALSVLTEPEFFLGSDRYLEEITEEIHLPVLRKDFTVDPYQIYEAKLLGASAVLLICALLTDRELAGYLETAHGLGLSALVEAHDWEEIDRAVAAGARVIGVNNRDLRTFTVNVHNSADLREKIPSGVLSVSESGISTPDHVGELYRNGTNGVLIGEAMMRSDDKAKMLAYLRSECHDEG